MTVLALIAVASTVIGAWSGRWVALVVPSLLVAVYYGGLTAGWWGNGVGDAWQAVALVVIAVITSGTAVAVAVARSSGRRVAGAVDSGSAQIPSVTASAGRSDPVIASGWARLAVSAVLVGLAAFCVYLSWGGLRNLSSDYRDGLAIVYVLFGAFWLTLAAAAAWAAVRINRRAFKRR